MVRHIAVVAILLAALARPSFADVTGPALVIDGDTLVVADERIRLEGIDAPALRQNAPADDRLFALLREGRYVNVLSSRQMGKSSLVMRTAHRLRLRACG